MPESLLKMPKNNLFKIIVNFLVLGIWLVIQYSRGNTFLLILFFIVLFSALLFKHRSFLIIAVTIFLITITSVSTLLSLINLKDIYTNSLKNPYQSFQNIFTPNTGTEILPSQVKQMLIMLEDNHLKDYQLSSELENDIYIMQRMVESAWPIKLENSSLNYFSSRKDLELYASCKILDQKEDVVLVYCD